MENARATSDNSHRNKQHSARSIEATGERCRIPVLPIYDTRTVCRSGSEERACHWHTRLLNPLSVTQESSAARHAALTVLTFATRWRHPRRHSRCRGLFRVTRLVAPLPRVAHRHRSGVHHGPCRYSAAMEFKKSSQARPRIGRSTTRPQAISRIPREYVRQSTGHLA